jgi:hypothetical protein
MGKKLRLRFIKDKYSIIQLPKDSEMPEWLDIHQHFVSFTRTDEECSIICKSSCVPKNKKLNQNKGWIIIKIEEKLDLTLVGVLYPIIKILKDEKISVYPVATYNTDYILIKEKDKNKAINCLLKYYEVLS